MAKRSLIAFFLDRAGVASISSPLPFVRGSLTALARRALGAPTSEESRRAVRSPASAPRQRPALSAPASSPAPKRTRKSARTRTRPRSAPTPGQPPQESRSEEHTTELQSLMRISYAVFCLNKKKHQTQRNTNNTDHT